jgi:TRAP-type transport system periplasmic protein
MIERLSMVGFRLSAKAVAGLLVALLVLVGCGGTDDAPPGEAAPPPDPTDDDGADPDDGDDRSDETFHIRFANLLPPGDGISDSFDWFFDEVTARTDGRVTFEHAYAGSLLPGEEIIAGVSDGRAEAGHVVPLYEPGNLPLNQLAMIPVHGHNPEARARGLTRLYEENEDFRAEYTDRGIRQLVFHPTGPWGMAVRAPVESREDLRGWRVRMVGGVVTVYERHYEVEPVVLAGQDVYEALQRGTIDASLNPFDVIVGGQHHEVAPYVLIDGIGYFGNSGIGFSLNVWESLPADIQAVILEVAEEYPAQAVQILQERGDDSCDRLLEGGGSVISLPEEDIEWFNDQIGDSLVNEWKEDAIGSGVDPATVDQVWDEYNQYVEEHLPNVTYEDALVRCLERSQE